MNVRNQFRLSAFVVAALVGVGVIPALAGPAEKPGAPLRAEKGSEPRDLKAEAREYIRRADAPLPPEQQRIRDDVLSRIPAVCCKTFSMATCCCSCNLAKSIWGLSNTMLVKHKADSKQLRAAVLDWIGVNNPSGWTGDACFTGGCGRPFAENGCGGMDDGQVVFQSEGE